jgi:hypothetical protein
VYTTVAGFNCGSDLISWACTNTWCRNYSIRNTISTEVWYPTRVWQHTEPYTLSVKLSDFTVWHDTWRKNWVNCAVLTGNSAGLRTVLSSDLSHTTAQFTQGIQQFPQFTCPHHDGIISRQSSVSSNSFIRWTSHDILLSLSFLLFG